MTHESGVDCDATLEFRRVVNTVRAAIFVMPAKAGIQFSGLVWFPAFAGMTWLEMGK